METERPPLRGIRAAYDDETIVVYQAYSHEIADAALAAGHFVPPFGYGRMTWVKPSFLWMMYRSAWATSPNQERVLAIRIPREEFGTALRNACLSSFDPDVYGSHDAWRRRLARTTVRVQWDPEKDLHLNALPWRSIQVGLGGDTAKAYATRWIRELDDVTPLARDVRDAVRAGDLAAAEALLPQERSYPLPPEAADAVGATRPT